MECGGRRGLGLGLLGRGWGALERVAQGALRAPSCLPGKTPSRRLRPRGRTWGKTLVPTLAQKAKVAADRPMTPYAKRPATSSASRWMGAVRAWRDGRGGERGWAVGCQPHNTASGGVPLATRVGAGAVPDGLAGQAAQAQPGARTRWLRRLRELAAPRAGPDRFYLKPLWPLGTESGCVCGLTYVVHSYRNAGKCMYKLSACREPSKPRSVSQPASQPSPPARNLLACMSAPGARRRPARFMCTCTCT